MQPGTPMRCRRRFADRWMRRNAAREALNLSAQSDVRGVPADVALQPLGFPFGRGADFLPKYDAASVVLTQRVGAAPLLGVTAHQDAVDLLL